MVGPVFEPTPEETARLIFEQGPLSRQELKELSNDRAYEYFQLMNSFLRELGPERFVEMRERLREGVLSKIVNRPDQPGPTSGPSAPARAS